MMPTLIEKQLQFEFPNNWDAEKFDDTSFYRNQFSKLSNARLVCSKCEAGVECPSCGHRNVVGTKGTDFLVIEPTQTCWHIECKDYRKTRISSFEFLADEVAIKVRDTLACLVVAQHNANDDAEQDIARKATRAKRHRIVLHLEQPSSGRSLDSTTIRRANVLQKLKQFVKSIDPHPLVIDMKSMHQVAWKVTQIG